METYQQTDASDAEQFLSKIWEPREHNNKAEWISSMVKQLKVLEEEPKKKIHIDLLRRTLKYIKLENGRP